MIFFLVGSICLTIGLMGFFGIINICELATIILCIAGTISVSIAVCVEADIKDKLAEQQKRIHTLEKELKEIHKIVDNLIVQLKLSYIN